MSQEVQNMFASIAPTYDRVNQILSFGIHHRWRQRLIKESQVQAGHHILDCATGTGDLALEFAQAAGPESTVTGTDFCPEMLETAPQKAKERGLIVDFQVADAMNLPFEDNQFDIASISFGIRNVDDPVVCLREMARVVRPQGRVMVLEFGQPHGAFGALFRVYSNSVIPTVGGILSKNREAYQYLPKTSAEFPAGDDFLALMEQADAYAERTAIPLTNGVAWIYRGIVA